MGQLLVTRLQVYKCVCVCAVVLLLLLPFCLPHGTMKELHSCCFRRPPGSGSSFQLLQRYHSVRKLFAHCLFMQTHTAANGESQEESEREAARELSPSERDGNSD